MKAQNYLNIWKVTFQIIESSENMVDIFEDPLNFGP